MPVNNIHRNAGRIFIAAVCLSMLATHLVGGDSDLLQKFYLSLGAGVLAGTISTAALLQQELRMCP